MFIKVAVRQSHMVLKKSHIFTTFKGYYLQRSCTGAGRDFKIHYSVIIYSPVLFMARLTVFQHRVIN